jgi:hypothetical protein
MLTRQFLKCFQPLRIKVFLTIFKKNIVLKEFGYDD